MDEEAAAQELRTKVHRSNWDWVPEDLHLL